jgi:hypothetical protein
MRTGKDKVDRGGNGQGDMAGKPGDGIGGSFALRGPHKHMTDPLQPRLEWIGGPTLGEAFHTEFCWISHTQADLNQSAAALSRMDLFLS